jgi:hypothetical protein
MFRPRIMTGISCILVFQFVRFLFLHVRQYLHNALVFNLSINDFDTDRFVFAIIGKDQSHFK